MNIGEMLKNPWVIGGGVILVVIAVAYSGGTASGNAGTAYATGAELNLAAQKYAAADFATSAQMSMQAQQGNVQEALGFMNLLGMLHGQSAQVQAQLAAVNGSIINTQITANANVQIDRINSNLKLGQTWIGANVAMAQIDADVTKAKITAKASEHASNNSLIGGVINGALKALPAIIAA